MKSFLRRTLLESLEAKLADHEHSEASSTSHSESLISPHILRAERQRRQSEADCSIVGEMEPRRRTGREGKEAVGAFKQRSFLVLMVVADAENERIGGPMPDSNPKQQDGGTLPIISLTLAPLRRTERGGSDGNGRLSPETSRVGRAERGGRTPRHGRPFRRMIEE